MNDTGARVTSETVRLRAHLMRQLGTLVERALPAGGTEKTIARIVRDLDTYEDAISRDLGAIFDKHEAIFVEAFEALPQEAGRVASAVIAELAARDHALSRLNDSRQNAIREASDAMRAMRVAAGILEDA